MTTLKELAESLSTTTYALMEFAPSDITRDMTGDQEIDPDVEAMIRDAWNGSPEGPPDVVQENRNEDAVLQELYEVAEHAGYDEELGENL